MPKKPNTSASGVSSHGPAAGPVKAMTSEPTAEPQPAIASGVCRRSPPPRREQRLDDAQVLLGVHADRRLRRLHDGDRDAVLEKPELLEPLGSLEVGGRQTMKRLQ